MLELRKVGLNKSIRNELGLTTSFFWFPIDSFTATKSATLAQPRRNFKCLPKSFAPQTQKALENLIRDMSYKAEKVRENAGSSFFHNFDPCLIFT